MANFQTSLSDFTRGQIAKIATRYSYGHYNYCAFHKDYPYVSHEVFYSILDSAVTQYIVSDKVVSRMQAVNLDNLYRRTYCRHGFAAAKRAVENGKIAWKKKINKRNNFYTTDFRKVNN